MLNTSFYPDIGGVENSIRHIYESMKDMGWQVDILTRDPGRPVDYPSTINRYDIHTFGRFPFPFYFLSIFKRLYALKREKSYDVVISRNHITTVIAIMVGFKFVKYIVPGIVKFQNKKKCKSLSDYFSYYFNHFLQKIALKYSDLFVFSRTMQQQVYSISNRLVPIVHPGVDVSRFFPIGSLERAEIRRALLPQSFVGKKIILLLGRLTHIKGFSFVIDACKYLDDSYGVIIVGDGELKDYFNKKIEDQNLNDKVYLAGRSNQPEVFYKIADYFFLSSIHEPFGQVLLEAVSCGLPVFAFSDKAFVNLNTATSEMFNGFDSLVTFVDSADPINVAMTISSSQFFRERFNGDRERFLKNYSWEMLIDYIVRGL